MPESKPLNKPFKTPAGSKKKYSVYVKTKEGDGLCYEEWSKTPYTFW